MMFSFQSIWPTDHPHARGDHRHGKRGIRRKFGPSPRAWGSRGEGAGAESPLRTIPTRVGITWENRTISSFLTDHPHARGDHINRETYHILDFGPSPRAWGSQYAREDARLAARTIPTRVGITGTPCPACGRKPDHPHARGDHVKHGIVMQDNIGPSPRAWGSQPDYRRHPARGRTIPTRVGITSLLYLHNSILTDHPHARGDHLRLIAMSQLFDGPSPRAWGSLKSEYRIFRPTRTIPTRVGITSGDLMRLISLSDHPHARGDHCAPALHT